MTKFKIKVLKLNSYPTKLNLLLPKYNLFKYILYYFNKKMKLNLVLLQVIFTFINF